EDRAWRVNLFGDEVESIEEFDPLTGQKTDELSFIKVYSNTHYVTARPTLIQAISGIKQELKWRLDQLNDAGRLLEAQRLEQRTLYDLEMMEATGSCAGIENYSRYLTGRKPGEPPPTLFEYVPDNALVFVDESHVTVPQPGGPRPIRSTICATRSAKSRRKATARWSPCSPSAWPRTSRNICTSRASACVTCIPTSIRSSASRSSATSGSAPSTRWSGSISCARVSTSRNARWSQSSMPTRKVSC